MIASPVLHVPRAETTKAHRCAVERVLERMRRDLAQDLTLETMADLALMSPFHFNRVFRQLTGVPPGQFQAALRLEAAKRLLLTTSLSVFDVCFEVGYRSPGAFIRRFTELVGLSPQRLRQAVETAGPVLAGLGKLAAEARESSGLPSQGTVQVRAPQGFEGLLFAALFPRSIPQGVPLACAVLSGAGLLSLPPVPDGEAHLFVAALPAGSDPRLFLLREREILRSGIRGQKLRVNGSCAAGPIDLVLRPAEPVDPPILCAFPLLAAERLMGQIAPISAAPMSQALTRS